MEEITVTVKVKKKSKNKTPAQRARYKQDCLARDICYRCGCRPIAHEAGNHTECLVCTEKKKLRDLNAKIEAFMAYGGCFCGCPGCIENNPQLLTLDHINNNGGEARRNGERRGIGLYRALKIAGYPPGFAVRCFNCNSGRAINGKVCPHLEPFRTMPTYREELVRTIKLDNSLDSDIYGAFNGC